LAIAVISFAASCASISRECNINFVVPYTETVLNYEVEKSHNYTAQINHRYLKYISSIPENKRVEKTFTFICNEFQCGIGYLYVLKKSKGKKIYIPENSYGDVIKAERCFPVNEGLVGSMYSSRTSKTFLNMEMEKSVRSGLGCTNKANLHLLPVTKNGEVIAVIEISTFTTNQLVNIDEMTKGMREEIARLLAA